ncbi:MAG: hypothetical protein Q9M31_05415, partial [Mariprofundus sp.]|nr:hypothetical protein [Mariprofundus sp.]
LNRSRRMCDDKVNRCECLHKTFAELKLFANLEEAQKATGCGLECEGCLPYLHLMFTTGETSFDIDDPRLTSVL